MRELNGDLVDRVFGELPELQAVHPALSLMLTETGILRLAGEVRFRIEHQGTWYCDSYQVDVDIPDDYPLSTPTARETAGRIPSDFHKLESGGLCLGAPIEVLQRFLEVRQLLGFINDLLIPYLLSYTVFEATGKMPYGELPHGAQGLLAYYADRFDTNQLAALAMLKLIADGRELSLVKCPCGSGEAINICHGPLLDNLTRHRTREQWLQEVRMIVLEAESCGVILCEQTYLPRAMATKRQKRRRKKHGPGGIGHSTSLRLTAAGSGASILRTFSNASRSVLESVGSTVSTCSLERARDRS